MSRTLPSSVSTLATRRLRWKSGGVDIKPRFTSPPGVVLRQLKPDEVNEEPVLVCLSGRAPGCAGPTLHMRLGGGGARCYSCGTERRW